MPEFPEDFNNPQLESIQFVCEDIRFNLKNRILLRSWIRSVIAREKKKVGNLMYIFCSDEYLIEINRQFLEHDYYTDIITFSYGDTRIEGDIFISIDRVKENAKQYKVKMEEELHRVMVHGVLHLIGFKDKSPAESKLMRMKENEYLALLNLSI